MSEGNSISEHLNSFNRVCNEISGIGEVLKDEDKAIILLMSLPTSYGHIITSWMVGKKTLTLDEVQSGLHSNEVRRKSSKVEEGNFEAMVARVGRKGKGVRRLCYFCGKAGYMKKVCTHRLQWLEKKKGTSQEEEGAASLAESADMTDRDIYRDVFMVCGSNNTSKDKSWILDSGSSVHVRSNKGSFSTFMHKEGTIRLANSAVCRIRSEGMVRFAGSDGAVHTLAAVYVPKVCMNLVSLGALNKSKCMIQVHKGVMAISKGGREILHGEKCGGLYKLQENSISGGAHGRFHQGGVKVEAWKGVQK